jgi:cytoskeletal protein CcmA (bactofilin family)
MWSNKKEDEVRTPEPAGRPAPEPPRMAAEPPRGGTMEPICKIGKSIFIRGELSGSEDLTIEGTVEGKIELKEHNCVVGSTGKIHAEVHAKSVNIQGEVHGNIRAEDRIEIATSGTVKGDLVAPRIVISDGARFKGSVDMEKPGDGVRPKVVSGASVPGDVRAAVPVESRPIKA